MDWSWWLRIGPDPWIIEHPIVAAIMIGGLLVITIILIRIDENERANDGG